MARRKIDPAQVDTNPNLLLPELCAVDRISLTTYFKMKKLGIGPRETHFLDAIRVTPEDRRAWHRKLQKQHEKKSSQLAQERRNAMRRIAGRMAAASPRHVSKRRHAALEST